MLEWSEIVPIVVAVLGIIFGTTFALRLRRLVAVLKELGEAFTKTGIALEDGKVTKDELKDLLKEWYDVMNAVQLLIKR